MENKITINIIKPDGTVTHGFESNHVPRVGDKVRLENGIATVESIEWDLNCTVANLIMKDIIYHENKD